MKELSLSVARTESRSRLVVGRGLLDQLPSLIDTQKCSSIAIVADNGAPQQARTVASALGVRDEALVEIHGGERSKTVQGLEALWDRFAQLGLDRRSIIITLGGGATSDLVGFAAATYMRGVRFIHIPTTLLAQVDASIGGKTGINFRGVKNLIGAVMQPTEVIIDIDTLATLPAREVRSGFAEIIKHGVIADADYFEKATSRSFDQWSPDELVDIVFRSCQIKASIVESDQNEQGARKTLNFGHTIGHAIEAASLESGDNITHGEAVAIGMVTESTISSGVGLITHDDVERIRGGISQAGLPTTIPQSIDKHRLRDLMRQDKKNVAGQIRWTLLSGIGASTFDIVVPEEVVEGALTAGRAGRE